MSRTAYVGVGEEQTELLVTLDELEGGPDTVFEVADVGTKRDFRLSAEFALLVVEGDDDDTLVINSTVEKDHGTDEGADPLEELDISADVDGAELKLDIMVVLCELGDWVEDTELELPLSVDAGIENEEDVGMEDDEDGSNVIVHTSSVANRKAFAFAVCIASRTAGTGRSEAGALLVEVGIGIFNVSMSTAYLGALRQRRRLNERLQRFNSGLWVE
jgi:hypothetical protein